MIRLRLLTQTGRQLYQNSDNFSTKSFLARTREHNSQQFLSGAGNDLNATYPVRTALPASVRRILKFVRDKHLNRCIDQTNQLRRIARAIPPTQVEAKSNQAFADKEQFQHCCAFWKVSNNIERLPLIGIDKSSSAVDGLNRTNSWYA